MTVTDFHNLVRRSQAQSSAPALCIGARQSSRFNPRFPLTQRPLVCHGVFVWENGARVRRQGRRRVCICHASVAGCANRPCPVCVGSAPWFGTQLGPDDGSDSQETSVREARSVVRRGVVPQGVFAGGSLVCGVFDARHSTVLMLASSTRRLREASCQYCACATPTTPQLLHAMTRMTCWL